MPLKKLERRRQPQNSIKAIKSVLSEISWPVREVISHRSFPPSGTWANESFGYVLKIPKQVPVKKLWIGYLVHQTASPGIYAGLTPDVNRDPKFQALKQGYKFADFGKYILLKQLLPIEEIQKLEQKFGFNYLVKQYKNILKKTYPFYLRK